MRSRPPHEQPFLHNKRGFHCSYPDGQDIFIIKKIDISGLLLYIISNFC